MRYPRSFGFRARLARFFMGRNGPDALYYASFAASLVFIFLSGFFSNSPLWLIVFTLLYFLSFAYALFRFFSRNVAKRRKENAAFFRFCRALTMPLRRLTLRIRQRKTHVFRKCPACRATLRLSRIPGEHTVRCPSCQNRFSVRVKK